MLEMWRQSVLAFRGYNVTNLGRTAELLADARYEPILVETLREASRVCGAVIGKRVRLVDRVRREQETSLRTYPEAIALIMGVEIAQLSMLREVHGADSRHVRALMGYSLGEITALGVSGVVKWQDAMVLPLELARDCVELAAEVTLAVVFTRQRQLAESEIQRLCIEVNEQGEGVVGVSAWLSPNTVLVMGQGTTIDRLAELASVRLEMPLIVRKNQHRWPPLHTPIMWQRAIADRVSHRMHTLHFEFERPHPPIWSLVTGGDDYNEINQRDLLRKWVDHPQRLWDVLELVLENAPIQVVHVGPQPNIIPSTFNRLADNVRLQLKSNMGKRALAAAARRPWLAALLPQDTALLLAPEVPQIHLEDWLLAH